MKKRQWHQHRKGLLGDGYYWIAKSRLREMRHGLYEWPLHLCEKGWVDIDDFESAFAAALTKFYGGYDEAKFAETFRKARKAIERHKFWNEVSELMFLTYPGELRCISFKQMSAVSAEVDRRYAAMREAKQ